MIQFVWIIIKNTPIAGMRFIKITDQEEKERLEKFYGWLSSPTDEFMGKVQDIIIEGTKYYYHTNANILFITGADIEETSVPSIFIPELEDRFFQLFGNNIANSFDGKNTIQFRVMDKVLVELVKAFEARKIDTKGKRKSLDAFEVLNLPSELQMVALILAKMQVVTSEMVSQVTGLPLNEVERQLKEIYQRGHLYITTISNKSYFSIQPFESEGSQRIMSRKTSDQQPISSEQIQLDELKVSTSIPSYDSYTPEDEQKSKIDFSGLEVKKPSTQSNIDSIESAMMAPPNWDLNALSTESSEELSQEESFDSSLVALQDSIQIEEKIDITKEELVKREVKGIKLKDDPIAREIDKAHKMAIVIPKNGFLPPNALRRERGFISGKIHIPSDKNKDTFLLNNLFKKDLENIFEALLMGDFLVIASERPTFFEDDELNSLLEILILLAPHRELKCIKSNIFVHPKDADIVVVPKDLLKYYSWATVIDFDQNKVINGKASEFAKNLVKKLRKITDSKEYLHEVTTTASILLKIGQDINTLKVEGRSPDLYLNEVKKTFGSAALDAGLAISERLIRLHKDCAYLTGFYIRKGLDIAVRAIFVGDPLVVIGENPLDVFHIINSLSIFTPHKALNAQIWTTNFVDIDINNFDVIGAQEGTDKLFKGAVKVNLSTMSVYGGPRSEFLHEFLKEMWKRHSKERPKYIRDKVSEIFSNANKIVSKLQTYVDRDPTKQEIKELFNEFDPTFSEFFFDLFKNTNPDMIEKIKPMLSR